MADLYKLHRFTCTTSDEPLFAILATAIPGMSRQQARMAVKGGLVKINGTIINEPKHIVAQPAKIECDLRQGIKSAYYEKIHGAPKPQAQPITILYQDSQVVVVDKMNGIISAPSHKPGQLDPERGHVPELIRRIYRKRGKDLRFVGTVHRLDKETSGCLCFALQREAQRLLSTQFSTHAAGRTYRCFTVLTPKKKQDTLRGNLTRDEEGRRIMVHEEDEGKEMITHFKVLRSFKSKDDGRDLGAELEVQLETGRTHQIRVSLAAIGCPIYGDPVYAHRAKFAKGTPSLIKAPRMMLHAHSLSFDHPQSGKRITVEAPLPSVFTEFAKQLT